MDTTDAHLLRPRDRDSHDLSVQLTRYSVVDSMLLSLASFPGDTSVALPSSFDPDFPKSALPADDDPYLLPRRQSNQQSNQQATVTSHTHSSSYSDYAPSSNIDDTASRYAVYHSQSRPNALRTSSRKPTTPERTRHTNSFPPATSNDADDSSDDMPFRSRSTRHAKETSRASTLDLGLINGSTSPWSPSSNRSANLHTSSRDGGLRHTPKRAPRPPPLQSPEPPMAAYDFDAAPTPTVPAGPRRQQEAMSSGPPPVTPKKSAPSRQNSVKSSRTLRKSKTNPQQTGNSQDSAVRESARQFVSATNNLRNAQVAPTSLSAAPSPTVGSTRKTYPSPVAQTAPKEKAGFFRRVFGGSSKHQKEEEVPTSQKSVTAQPERPRTQPAQQNTSSSYKSASRPPTQDPHSTARGDGISGHQGLRKSSSSFFRRHRKRSVDQTAEFIPPVPPLQIPQMQAQHPNIGKINLMPALRGSEDYSLRNVMAPYLTNESTRGSNYSSSRFGTHEKSGTLHGSALESRINSRGGGSSHSNQSSTRGITDQPCVQSPVDMRPNLDTPHAPFPRDSTDNETPIAFKSASVPQLSSSPFDSTTNSNVAPMPSRPAPVPSPSLQIPSAKDIAALPPKGTAVDRPVLSPISDRSSASASTEAIRSLPIPDAHAKQDGFILDREALSAVRSSAQSKKASRVWLRPTESEEDVRHHVNADAVTHEDASKEDLSVPSLPVVQVEDPAVSQSTITAENRELAGQIFDGDESIVPKASAAAWLGRTEEKNVRTRTAYMELFDWSSMNILGAFRELCSKLILRGESQVLDRVIDGFTIRWCGCNPSHGFKGKDVVHTIVFALLMLNTDLHMTESDQHMSKNQFVKNTLPTLRSLAVDPPDTNLTAERTSLEIVSNRFSRLPRSDSETTQDGSASADGSMLLVNAPYEGSSLRNWETQIESILKSFYNSLRNDPLPLHGAAESQRGRQKSYATLSVSNGLRRTPSVLSKAPSDNISFRSRPGDMRSANNRYAVVKGRNRSRMLPNSSTFTFGSSRTSLDDQSIWSPAASTYGRTQNSMSLESLGTWGPSVPAPIGFAHAISRTIGQQQLAGETESIDLDGRSVPLLENEDLELHGPPWAKEGMLQHMVYMGSNGKRSKERRPAECFAVVSKGCMRLFSFGQSHSGRGGALRHIRQHKSKHSGSSSNSGQVVGGGNWLENADELGSYALRQAWAYTNPRSNRDNKFTFYLHLPSDEIHAFLVSSAELMEEWTWTINYWSGRLSRQPLIGGVSSDEYGWSERFLSSAAGDRHVSVLEWRPPAYSLLSSQLLEVDQKGALESYLQSIDEDFAAHSALRPRMAGHTKALQNWSRKAQYLTGETVKYKTWVNALNRAAAKKTELEDEQEN